MRWLAWAILLLVAALVFGFGLLAYAMYALVTVLVVSRLLARTWITHLAATRECNRLSVNVGEEVAVVVSIENRGLLPVAWMMIEDLLPRHALVFDPPSLRVTGRRLQVAMLGSRGRSTLFYQLRCNRRGYYQIGPALLETGDLFGLHRRYRVATEPHFLLVYPQVVPLAGYDIASRRPIGEIRLVHRLFEDPTRMAGVRRYEPGDAMSRVHWRATARTGQLHSKVFESSSIAGLTLLVDFHRDSYDARNEPYRSELVITTAASLANAVYEMGQQVGLVTNGRDAADRIRQEGWSYDLRTRDAARQAASMKETSDRLQPLVVETRSGSEQLLRIMEVLARMELTDGLSCAQLVEESMNRLPRDASVVALLRVASDTTVAALGALRRFGFSVTAIVNVYEDHEFTEIAGRLLSEGITPRHLKSETDVATICQAYVVR